MGKRSSTKGGPQRNGGNPRTSWMLGLAGLLVAVLLIGTGAVLWLGGGGAGGVAVGGPFTLESGAGKTVTDRDFRGKYMLVYFGYTFCPDVCPTTLNTVAEALDQLGTKADRIQPLFITVDPGRDDVAAVKQFAAAFTPRLIGLTGTPEQIAKVAKEYHVYYAKHQTGPGPNDYTMDHSSVIYLMSPEGKFVAPIRADASPEQMAADIARQIS